MKRFILILIMGALLQGCVAAFIAGAAAGGIIVYDRRNIVTMKEDADILAKINAFIYEHPYLNNKSHINATVFNNVVLLTGETLSPEARGQVVEYARQVPKVAKVYNEIAIAAPDAALTRSSDSLITAKVRTAMVGKSGLHSSSIKVVTENGVVYLMGVVSPSQANLAVDAARRVSGVQKVVKIFDYSTTKKKS